MSIEIDASLDIVDPATQSRARIGLQAIGNDPNGIPCYGLIAAYTAVVSLTPACNQGTPGTQPWLTQAAPATFDLVGTSAAATAQTLTQAAAGAGTYNALAGLSVSWSGGAPAAGANVQVLSGVTVLFDEYIGRGADTQGSIYWPFAQPLQAAANTALSVVVAAGGAGVTTKASAQGCVLAV